MEYHPNAGRHMEAGMLLGEEETETETPQMSSELNKYRKFVNLATKPTFNSFQNEKQQQINSTYEYPVRSLFLI